VKVLGYILTAAAILVGADVFVKTASQTAAAPETTETATSLEMSLHGTTGAPPPPPD
jgi:hypothetical protein